MMFVMVDELVLVATTSRPNTSSRVMAKGASSGSRNACLSFLNVIRQERLGESRLGFAFGTVYGQDYSLKSWNEEEK